MPTFNESWNIIQNNIAEIDDEIDNIIFSKNEFNIIIEGFAYGLFFELGKFWDIINEYKHGMLVLYYVLKTYPYGIFNLMYYHTIEQQQELIAQLDEIDVEKNIIVPKYSQHMQNYKTYLNDYYKNYNSRPCTLNFNNFINIQFNKTGLTYDLLPQKTNLVIIHVGFNNECETYIYPFTKSIHTNYLTETEMNEFKQPYKIHVLKSDKCYEIINNDDVGDNNVVGYQIILCYDNNRDIKKCVFSCGKSTYTKKEIEIITHGGIIGTVSREANVLYLSKMTYARFNALSEISDKSNETITGTTELIKTVNENVKKSFNRDYRKAIKNIVACFPDEKYFKYYMEGLKYKVENDKLEFPIFLEYVKLYFIPIINN